MRNARALIERLRSRLSQDRVTEAELTVALAEILAATPEGLSGPDSLLVAQEIRELKQAWRESTQRPTN